VKYNETFNTMSEKELTALLGSREHRNTKRGWRCPDDNQLAAYVNGQSAQRRKDLEAHFSDCKACLETLAFLVQTSEEPVALVPAHLLVRARSLAEKRSGFGWQWRWAFATAAACLLIAFTLVTWKSRELKPSPDMVAQGTPPSESVKSPVDLPPSTTVSQLQKPKRVETPGPVVRGTRDQTRPTLLFPRDGSVIKPRPQYVRWQAVVDASFYEIKIVTEDGSPVLTERTNNTAFQMGVFRSGKYFVTIVAHLSGDRTVASVLTVFNVRE
jgi:hypothetical protein